MPFWEIYSYFYALCLGNLFPYRRLLEDLNHSLQVKEGDRILDAGCGPGLVIGKIVEENKGRRVSVIGVELSKGMIRHARRRCKDFANVKLQVGDLNSNLDFSDGFFDKVICCNTLYALENPQKVISEFHRVLKPGASLVITNPKPNAEMKELIREHVRTLKTLTPLRRRLYHVFLFLLLLPVNFVVVGINTVIVKKGRSGKYHFLGEEDWKKVLEQGGFHNVDIKSCYAGQNWLVRAEKW
jgi:ubiquinone/menaquinone biosynthesis C-methylase UbiE